MFFMRFLLAWLLMAAIPLQGLAAASMLFCGMEMQNMPVQAQSAVHIVATTVATTAGSHYHSQHDHSQHGKAAPAKVVKTSGDIAKQLPEVSHKCPVCASCCNLVAITEFPPLAIIAPASQAELAEPFVLIQARPLPVPDKPPRA